MGLRKITGSFHVFKPDFELLPAQDRHFRQRNIGLDIIKLGIIGILGKVAGARPKSALDLNMGENAPALLGALAVAPAPGQWTLPIIIPKTCKNNFPTSFAEILALYRMTIPVAKVRLQFDYAAVVAKIWASIHTPDQYSELCYDRIQATFGEPVYLSLAHLQLKDLPPAVAELDTLEEIDLSNNRLTDLPDWLVTMPRLRKLNLAHNRLTTLAPLYAAPWIHDIICDGNPLADITTDAVNPTDPTERGQKGQAKSDLPVD